MTTARAALVPIFLRLDPIDIALVKFVFESYEGVAVVRTLDRRRAIIVALASSDFVGVAFEILTALQQMVKLEEVPAPPEAGGDWLLEILAEEE
jgi:hypothetical protein